MVNYSSLLFVKREFVAIYSNLMQYVLVTWMIEAIIYCYLQYVWLVRGEFVAIYSILMALLVDARFCFYLQHFIVCEERMCCYLQSFDVVKAICCCYVQHFVVSEGRIY